MKSTIEFEKTTIDAKADGSIETMDFPRDLAQPLEPFIIAVYFIQGSPEGRQVGQFWKAKVALHEN